MIFAGAKWYIRVTNLKTIDNIAFFEGSNPSFSAKCKTLENAEKASVFKGFSLFLNHLKLSKNVSKYPKK